jgi:hypothetical protein
VYIPPRYFSSLSIINWKICGPKRHTTNASGPKCKEKPTNNDRTKKKRKHSNGSYGNISTRNNVEQMRVSSEKLFTSEKMDTLSIGRTRVGMFASHVLEMPQLLFLEYFAYTNAYLSRLQWDSLHFDKSGEW